MARFWHGLLRVAPLSKQLEFSLPPGLRGHLECLQFVPRLCIPTTPSTCLRRVELNQLSSSLITVQTATKHSSPQRLHIQTCIYDFAFSCLGLTPGATILDLGCGSTAFFGGPESIRTIRAMGFHLIGVDLFPASGLCQSAVDFIQLHLHRSLPLREASIDYLVSVSCLQGILRHPESRVITELLVRELMRLLSGGSAVIQFYPAESADLDLLTRALVTAWPRLSGCAILARPLKARGFKLFVYFLQH